MIRSDAYPVDGKMPAEQRIVEQMGVSRPSVQEAISALQIVDILESRPSDHTYISEDLALEDLSVQIQRLLEKSDCPHELLRARKAVEIGVVRLAVQVATDEDIQHIKTAWNQKSEYGRQGDYKIYPQCGRELHLSRRFFDKNEIDEPREGR